MQRELYLPFIVTVNKTLLPSFNRWLSIPSSHLPALFSCKQLTNRLLNYNQDLYRPLYTYSFIHRYIHWTEQDETDTFSASGSCCDGTASSVCPYGQKTATTSLLRPFASRGGHKTQPHASGHEPSLLKSACGRSCRAACEGEGSRVF